jgi:SAM-dependent methyltransferase
MSNPAMEIVVEASPESPWERHAALWQHIGPPLRPCEADLQVFRHELKRMAAHREHAHSLILGVTEEITALEWPTNSSLIAVDSSTAMLARRWRPPRGITSWGVLGLWDRLPVMAGSIDLIVSDGSLSILPNATAVAGVLRELATALHPSGRVVVRVFVRDEQERTPGEVIDGLRRGEFGNFHVFKWRLLMSMHRSASDGVLLEEIYHVVQDAVPDRRALSRLLGWPIETIATIDSYRGVTGRYFFPSLPQLQDLAAADFVLAACHTHPYELGDRCPMLVWDLK